MKKQILIIGSIVLLALLIWLIGWGISTKPVYKATNSTEQSHNQIKTQ